MKHNEIIPLIANELKKHSGIIFELIDDCELLINPLNEKGFEISFVSGESGGSIFFNNFHWDFDNSLEGQKKLLHLLESALTGRVRIKVWSKQNFEYKWFVEFQDKNGNWAGEWTMKLPVFRFWIRSETHYLINEFLSKDYSLKQLESKL